MPVKISKIDMKGFPLTLTVWFITEKRVNIWLDEPIPSIMLKILNKIIGSKKSMSNRVNLIIGEFLRTT